MNRNQMNNRKSTMWIAVLALAGLLLPTRAAMIAQYEFANLTSSDTETNSTASDFTIVFPTNTAGTTSTAGGTIFARSTEVDGNTTTTGDETGAIDKGHYFSFTVTPDSNYQIDLTTLSFDILLDADPTSSPTPEATWFIKTSIGGFGAGDPTVGSRNAPVSQTDTALETINPLIDMSGLTTLSSSTEFRLYLYDNQHSSGIVHRLDNVILNGDVSVIPEPTTLWLAALSLVAVLATKRRWGLK